MASDNTDPPYYILLSRSSLPSQASTNPPLATFVHPIIEYHFADDPPAALLPSSPSESLIILDYDGSGAKSEAQSLEKNFVITGVNVTDAPGVSTVRDGEPRRNDRIYVIETISGVEGSSSDSSLQQLDSPHLILAQFKERNALLKQVLDSTSSGTPIIKDTMSPPQNVLQS